MTSHVIAALQACEKRHGGTRFGKYTCTDISHAFFEDAQESFKEHTGRMEFRVLDIEKDTVEQGYQEETYDLVVAGAVLHTTQSLQSTLQKLRKCLKPGGKLLFFENVLPDLALQFSFGTLSGWWRGKEDWRARPRDQYTSEAQWQELLKNCGFSGNDVVLNDQDSKTFSIIISTAVASRERPSNTQRVLMCLDKESNEQRGFARGIEQTLDGHIVYACETCDLEDISSMSINPNDRVIVLCELGNSRLRSLTESEFRSLQGLMQKSKNILWLTETIVDDEQSIFAGMSTGFLRTMRSEATNSQIVTLALQRSSNDWLSSVDHAMPHVKGCINAAMVLQDAIFEHMSHDQWQIAVRAKVQTSWNLHKLLPSGMDFFVLLSSLAGVFGNVSQANYAAGNTFQDALADNRTAHGEQAISINLGWMRTVFEKEDYQSFRTKGADMAKIEENELMLLLDIYCDPAYSHSHRSQSQVLIGTITPADLLSNGLKVPHAMDRPLFSTFASCPDSHVAADCGDCADAAVLFRQTDDIVQRQRIVADALAQKLARSLSIAHDDVDRDRPLFAYGVDSLVAVELRNWIGKEFSADVPMFDIMGGATITANGMLTVKNSTVGR